MKKNIPTVLLVDDCRFTRRAVSKAIEASLPDCTVLTAHSAKEGQKTGAAQPIHLFIVDLYLPDGSGIDFLADMLMVHPGASAIVMMESVLPPFASKCEWLDHVHFFAKPIDRSRLVRLIDEMLGLGVHRSRQPHLDAEPWSVRLDEFFPEDIVRLKTKSRASTAVEFVCRGETGVIHFQDGRVIRAIAGELSGMDALREIIRWQSGYATETALEIGPKHDGARRSPHDEKSPSTQDATARFSSNRIYFEPTDDEDGDAEGLSA